MGVEVLEVEFGSAPIRLFSLSMIISSRAENILDPQVVGCHSSIINSHMHYRRARANRCQAFFRPLCSIGINVYRQAASRSGRRHQACFLLRSLGRKDESALRSYSGPCQRRGSGCRRSSEAFHPVGRTVASPSDRRCRSRRPWQARRRFCSAIMLFQMSPNALPKSSRFRSEAWIHEILQTIASNFR